MSLTKEERAIVHAAARIKAIERKSAKKARPKSPKADRGRVRNNAYLAWLRRQPCVMRGYYGLFCGGPVQACHIRIPKRGEPPTGLQRKPDDSRCTPMCAKHHAEQHSMNETVFWRMHSLDPFEVAAEHFARFEKEGLPCLMRSPD